MTISESLSRFSNAICTYVNCNYVPRSVLNECVYGTADKVVRDRITCIDQSCKLVVESTTTLKNYYSMAQVDYLLETNYNSLHEHTDNVCLEILKCIGDTKFGLCFLDSLPPLGDAFERIIYFIPKDVNSNDDGCYEYMLTTDSIGQRKWENIGSTVSSLDNRYYTKTEIDNTFNNYFTCTTVGFCGTAAEAVHADMSTDTVCFGGKTYAEARTDMRSGLTGCIGTITGLKVIPGANIAKIGTPSVIASPTDAEGKVSFEFNYLKGEVGPVGPKADMTDPLIGIQHIACNYICFGNNCIWFE